MCFECDREKSENQLITGLHSIVPPEMFTGDMTFARVWEHLGSWVK
jgi:hypothetical protein